MKDKQPSVFSSDEPQDQEEESVSEDREETAVDQEEIQAVSEGTPPQYYLQTVKVGEQPEWPGSKEEFDVYSRPLDGGLIQYFAYPKDAGKTADDLPHAEEIAAKNKSSSPVIIIDQVSDHLTPGNCLELILVRHGHALAKTDSNLDNLEGNITSLLDLGRETFGITVEHFMSTSNVSPEVEKRLDDLEEAEENETRVFATKPKESEVTNASPYFTNRTPVTSENKRSIFFILVPILIVIIIFAVVVYYRGILLSALKNQINPPKPVVVEITPIPTPSPTPTITVDRAAFKVRVLNGTPQTGAAGVLADQLKEKGWQIDKTGNATSSAITESYVRSKPGMDDAIKVLIDDVSDYQASSSSSSLKPADKADLEFVIGKK